MSRWLNESAYSRKNAMWRKKAKLSVSMSTDQSLRSDQFEVAQQKRSPRGHILKFLALATEPQVLETCADLGSRTALFFEWLEIAWKTFWRPFFGEHLRLCPWPLPWAFLSWASKVLSLASNFFVFFALVSSLVSSTPPLLLRTPKLIEEELNFVAVGLGQSRQPPGAFRLSPQPPLTKYWGYQAKNRYW